MVDLKIYQEEQLLLNYYVIKLLILLKIQNFMGTKETLLQWFKDFKIKSLRMVLLKMKYVKPTISIRNAEANHQNKIKRRKV